jgi:hypothetical protein
VGETPARLPRDGIPDRGTIGLGEGVTIVRSATTPDVTFTAFDSDGLKSE